MNGTFQELCIVFILSYHVPSQGVFFRSDLFHFIFTKFTSLFKTDRVLGRNLKLGVFSASAECFLVVHKALERPGVWGPSGSCLGPMKLFGSSHSEMHFSAFTGT